MRVGESPCRIGHCSDVEEWCMGCLPSTLHSADGEDSNDGAVLRDRAEFGDNRFWFSVRLVPDGRIAQIRCC